ncbi:hypothetical protein B0J18DRAFT_433592 [Chaetomium sp. MPI-SDFR-AT-0129]|nr:hypothetical protein B0J18DRAFT_433592 [Chaetomium sp. MPI-SDFR-AT-0129]
MCKHGVCISRGAMLLGLLAVAFWVIVCFFFSPSSLSWFSCSPACASSCGLLVSTHRFIKWLDLICVCVFCIVRNNTLPDLQSRKRKLDAK